MDRKLHAVVQALIHKRHDRVYTNVEEDSKKE